MNFRTESFDLPQNEHRRCLSCDMAETLQETHARDHGRGGRPRLTVEVYPVKKRTIGARECFHEPPCPDYFGAAACAAITSGDTRSPRVEITLSMSPYPFASSADMKKSRTMSRSICSTGRPVCFA